MIHKLTFVFLVFYSATALGQPVFEACATVDECLNSSSCELSAPSGVDDDDLLVAFVVVSDIGNDPFTDTPRINETGWTTRATRNSTAGTDKTIIVSTKIASSESGTYTLDLVEGASGTEDFTGVICVFNTVHTTDVVDATCTVAAFANSDTFDPPAITTNTDNAMVLVSLGTQEDTATNIVPPTNYTEIVDFTSGHNEIAAAYRVITTAGSEDPGTFSGLGTNADPAGATCALKPAVLTFTSGPSEAPATDGFTISGTLSGGGTLTAYAVGVNPGDGTPTCAQIKSGNNDGGTSADLSANEVWTTGVGNDFLLTKSGAWPRYDIHICGSDGTDDTAVTSLTDQDRSADTSQAITVSTSVSTTSAFALQSENTCDTTDESPIITGCADTSWLDVGMLVDLSAGFADLTDIIVEAVTSDTITLENAANATTANITITQDPYYSPTVATGDVVEGNNLTGIGVTGTHTGSDNASILTDSAKSFVVDVHINNVISNDTDGSSCTITDSDATTVTCTLAGGTDNDWDTSDAYTILLVLTVGVDLEISFSGASGSLETWKYNIQDVSDTSDGDFDSGPPAWTTGDDTMFFFNTRPDFSDLESPNNILVLDFNVAMTTFDLSDFCTEPDSEALTFVRRSGTLPTGLSEGGTGNKDITGTPTVEDETGVTLNYTCGDPGGLVDAQDMLVWVVDTVTAPDFTTSDLDAALALELTTFPWRESPTMTATFKCHNSESNDQVLTQSPAASTEVSADQQFSVTVSRGPLCNLRRRRAP